MEIYTARVYQWHAPIKDHPMKLGDLVDITDEELIKKCYEKVNHKKKPPIDSINFLQSIVTLSYTRQTKKSLVEDMRVIAADKTAAKEVAYGQYVIGKHALLQYRHNVQDIHPRVSVEVDIKGYNKKHKDRYRGTNRYEGALQDVVKVLSEGFPHDEKRGIWLLPIIPLALKGIVEIDIQISPEEYAIQEALGHSVDILLASPIKLRTGLVEYLSHTTKQIVTVHPSIPVIIREYNASKGDPK